MRVRKTNDQPDTHFSRTSGKSKKFQPFISYPGKVLGFKKFGWKARDTVPFKDYNIHGCMSVYLLLHKQMTLMFLGTVYSTVHLCLYCEFSGVLSCAEPALR